MPRPNLDAIGKRLDASTVRELVPVTHADEKAFSQAKDYRRFGFYYSLDDDDEGCHQVFWDGYDGECKATDEDIIMLAHAPTNLRELLGALKSLHIAGNAMVARVPFAQERWAAICKELFPDASTTSQP